MSRKKIAILGSSGQDGRLLTSQLLEDGYQVGLFSRKLSEFDAHASVTKFDIDLTDTRRLKSNLEEFSPDEIVNFASISSVYLAEKYPEKSYQINFLLVSEILNFLPALCHTTGKEIGFVQASSSEMYGQQVQEKINEESTLSPTNTYGKHKSMSHELILNYTETRFVRAAILFNHESVLRPETFASRKISSTVSKIAQGLESQLVLGNLYATRDWGYAPDYVAGIKKMLNNPDCGQFVFSTGDLHSIFDFCEIAFKEVGIDSFEKYIVSSSELLRKTDTVGLAGNSKKAFDQLGWSPTINFSEMVREMVQHDTLLLKKL